MSRVSSGLAFVVVALSLATGPRRALAEGTAGMAAQQATQQAQQAYDAGRKQDAIEAFKRAYELSGDVSLLFRLGEVSGELGQDLAAYRFYRAYLGRDPRGRHRETAERAARTLEAKLSAAAAPTLVAPAAPPAPSLAANVAAVAPAAPPPSPPSRSVAPTVDVRAAPAVPAPPLPRWLPWVSLTATVALGAGAVFTGLEASRRYDQLRGSCGQTVDGCSQAEIDGIRSSALNANLLWAAAGAGAIASGVTFYVNTREAGLSGVWSF